MFLYVRSLHIESEMFVFAGDFFRGGGGGVFVILCPLLSKCWLRMWKHRRSNLIWVFLGWTKVSEAVCKRDWHNRSSDLFFNKLIFWTRISDWVCKDLYNGSQRGPKQHCMNRFVFYFFHFFYFFTTLVDHFYSHSFYRSIFVLQLSCFNFTKK